MPDLLLDQIRSNWNAIRQNGAFVFDIDETLMSPDHSLKEAPEAAHVLEKLLAAGMRVALVSGSPGAVLANRVVRPLQELPHVKAAWLERLTLYVNGGTSKWMFDPARGLKEEIAFARKHLIAPDIMEKIRIAVELCLQNRLEFEVISFEKIFSAWGKKRDRQWRGLRVKFQDMYPGPVSIQCLDDYRMAELKAGQNSETVNISYPFINTRGLLHDENGGLLGVSGITPTGFYALSTAQGDDQDLDARDRLIDLLKKQLGRISHELSFRKAGRSSVDITPAGSDKASALHDYLQTQSLDAASVYYFGDEFYEGGNDQPIAENQALRDSGLHIFALNQRSAPQYGHVQWLGKSTHDLHLFFKSILM